MKKCKALRRIACLGLSIWTIALSSSPAVAAPLKVLENSVVESTEMRYDTINYINSSLTINNRGKASCTADIAVRNSYTFDASIELQQKKGTKWTTVKTWNKSGTMIWFTDSYYVTSGYDYRLKLDVEIHDSNGVLKENPVVYSSVHSY